jgi:carboxynorspermidine decarboxylase
MNFNEIPSPCYVLEKNLLFKNLEVFKRIEQESGVWALCALKGFAFYHVFDDLAKTIHGATASSLHEAMLAAQYFKDVHVCAPVYIEKEFGKITDLASHITFNTLAQYERFGAKLQPKNTALLRINPEYSEVTTDMYNPCRVDSRLGVTQAELKAAGGLPEGIKGLHVHALCENDSTTLERLFERIEEKFGSQLHAVKYLNIGGGHLVTKQGYNVDHLIQQIKAIQEKYKLQVIMEPGSAYGWQTGFLRAEVQDVISKPEVTVVMLDVSFAAHMPDCLEMPYQPNARGFATEKVAGKLKIRFGGNTCLAGDEMGDYFVYALPKVGDVVIFEDMIHYTMVKTTTFNGVNLPSIGMINKQQKFVMLKQMGFDDYKSRL